MIITIPISSLQLSSYFSQYIPLQLFFFFISLGSLSNSVDILFLPCHAHMPCSVVCVLCHCNESQEIYRLTLFNRKPCKHWQCIWEWQQSACFKRRKKNTIVHCTTSWAGTSLQLILVTSCEADVIIPFPQVRTLRFKLTSLSPSQKGRWML